MYYKRTLRNFDIQKATLKNNFDMPLNNELREKRNLKIYNRYKELYDLEFLRHERVLKVLSEEFFFIRNHYRKNCFRG